MNRILAERAEKDSRRLGALEHVPEAGKSMRREGDSAYVRKAQKGPETSTVDGQGACENNGQGFTWGDGCVNPTLVYIVARRRYGPT